MAPWRKLITLNASLINMANSIHSAFSGGLCGFVVYDCLHWAMHHTSLPAHMQELKKYHLEHHYKDSDNGFVLPL